MKVCISNKYQSWKDAQTGKGFFAQRLIAALSKLGVDVTTSKKEPVDIDLQFGKIDYKPMGKSIVRLGPAHLERPRLNDKKESALRKASGIIYQSEFSKKMCDSIIGKAKNKTKIIFNGADPDFYNNASPYKSDFKYNYLLSTREWTAQKRLKQATEAFIAADVKDSALWITGRVEKEDRIKKDNILYLGGIVQPELAKILKTCDVLIHSVYADACPNAVIEALVAGCSVICGDQGGTKELGCHYVVKEKEWDFRPFKLKNTPKIDMPLWVEAINIIKERQQIKFDHLYIENIAKQYLAFFEEVLGG